MRHFENTETARRSLRISVKKVFVTLVAAACTLSGCTARGPTEPADVFSALKQHDIVDLTHTLDSAFPFIPVPGITFPFELLPIATLQAHGVAANAWRIHEHVGTQIDAPNHFVANGVAIDALGAADLIVPAVVIDFRKESVANRDAVLSVEHIRSWEMEHGPIPSGAVVLLCTGWHRRVTDSSYIGLDANGVKHFPGFGPEAADFLARERKVWGVGVDTLSFDVGIDHTYAAHRALLGAGKWALEALANLDRLPPTGAVLFVGAPKVRGATGGIARVIALVPSAHLPNGALEGRWRSSSIEALGSASGPARYLMRDFSFAGNRWSVDFTVFADAAGEQPLFRGRNEGTFEIGTSIPLASAYEATFSFDLRSLTALTDATATALRNAGCGTVRWRVGVPQDVTASGCTAFRVPSVTACPAEHDVVSLRERRLYLGARPAKGDLCAPADRPTEPGSAALVPAS
jgi:kynurenine formamidase